MLAASAIPTPAQLKFPLYASFKLDGIRSPIIDGKAMSRKLLPLPNAHYQTWVTSNRNHLEGIDCEVISGSPTAPGVFHRTQSAIMSVDGTPDFKIYVFDAFAPGMTLYASVRYEALQGWYADLPDTLQQRVVLLEQRLIHNIEELKLYMAEAMDSGYEGLILKKPTGHYKNGRSTVNEGTLLKWKEFADDEAVIVAVNQGKTNTNAKVKDALGHSKRSTAKAGMVLTETCGGFKVFHPKFGTFDVSTGPLTKPELEAIWLNREQWIGRTIVFTYQPYGVIGLPRFPGFNKLLSENNVPHKDEDGNDLPEYL